MTQAQYDTIVKIIQNGAPALANELISAIAELITDYQQLKIDAENARDEATKEEE